MPTPSNKIQSLHQQIENLEENLRLIAERKSEYVQPSEIPLQLLRDEREMHSQLEELRAKLARSIVTPAMAFPTRHWWLWPLIAALIVGVGLVILQVVPLLWGENSPGADTPHTFVIGEWQNLTPGVIPNEAIFTEGTRAVLYPKLSASSELQGISWEVQQMTPAAQRVPTYWIEGSYEYRETVRLTVQIFGDTGEFVAEATAVATAEEQADMEDAGADVCILDLQNRLALDILEKLNKKPALDNGPVVAEIPTSSCKALRLNNQAVDLILDYNDNNLVVAQSLLEDALALDPNYADAHNNLAHVYELQGQDSQADEEYIQAIELDPHNPLYLYNLGRLREINGDYEDAVAVYKAAIDLDPLYAIAYNNLAFTYLQMDQPSLALETLRPALGLEFSSDIAAYLYKNLGRAYLLLGQSEEAISALEEARQHHLKAYNTPFAETLFYLAQAYSETDETGLACATLSEYKAVAGEDESQRQTEAYTLGTALGC